jgi:N-methylhydantoinase A
MSDSSVVPGAAASTIAGVDVGGTFTDILIFDETTRTARVAKVPSTRTREAAGFLAGLRSAGTAIEAIGAIVHGTTVGTNALLERTGARCGVITTAGFRDVLEMRRRDRPSTWGLRGTFEPVVPRDLRLEVAERTGADGSVVLAVDPDEVRDAARTLLERGAESLVIAFINAYANDTNEQAALAAVLNLWPNEHLATAGSILGEIREFERSSTAALNGYLQPVVGTYLGALEAGLDEAGFAGELLVVQSNGGVMAAAEARHLPVRTALSGPAAGVIAAARCATDAGIPDVITCDMGGTSFDVALVTGGQAATTQEAKVDFGLVIRTPMVEISTIGAGGGSIARVDAGGILRIGPESAGSVPGPACYGRGNDRPTVTDANLVLGRIDAEEPLGDGLGRLDVEAAQQALITHVGDPLGLDLTAAAAAVIQVANAALAGAIRLVSIERGHDPERFALLPFGGAGALHVCALLSEIGGRRALVPRFPGLTSALGCVLADMRHDIVHTLNVALDELDEAALEAECAAHGAAGEERLRQAGVTIEDVRVSHEIDMAYRGQSHAITLPLPPSRDRAGLASAFAETYRGLFGHVLTDIPVRVLTLRTVIVGRRPHVDLSLFAPASTGSVEAAARSSRQVWSAGEWRQTAIYARLELPVGAQLEGPCVLQQPDTTIFIEPGFVARVDPLGNVIIERS